MFRKIQVRHYELTERLKTALVERADWEQRPAQELQEQLLAAGLAKLIKSAPPETRRGRSRSGSNQLTLMLRSGNGHWGVLLPRLFPSRPSVQEIGKIFEHFPGNSTY